MESDGLLGRVVGRLVGGMLGLVGVFVLGWGIVSMTAVTLQGGAALVLLGGLLLFIAGIVAGIPGHHHAPPGRKQHS